MADAPEGGLRDRYDPVQDALRAGFEGQLLQTAVKRALYPPSERVVDRHSRTTGDSSCPKR